VDSACLEGWVGGGGDRESGWQLSQYWPL
jgi:hypothetical protein